LVFIFFFGIFRNKHFLSSQDLQQVTHQEFSSNITNNANLIFEENTGEEDANWQLKITKWFESSVEVNIG
jgi:hypothetical protein